MFNLNTLLKINHAIGYLLTPFKSLIAYIWPDIKINKVFNFIKTVINIIGLISLFISVPIIVYLDPIDFLSESLQNGIIYIKNYYQDLIKTILKGFIKNIEEKIGDTEILESSSTQNKTSIRSEYKVVDEKISSNKINTNYLIIGGIIVLVIIGSGLIWMNHDAISSWVYSRNPFGGGNGTTPGDRDDIPPPDDENYIDYESEIDIYFKDLDKTPKAQNIEL